MSSFSLSACISLVARWACNDDRVLAAYIFGSRAKGTYRPNSDLDVAVKLAGEKEGLVEWIFSGKAMEKELDNLCNLKIDLQLISPDDLVVLPAVQEHGILVYTTKGERA